MIVAATATLRRRWLGVGGLPHERTVQCPCCHAAATGERWAIRQAFFEYDRAEPTEETVYAQVFRCYSCGFIFPEGYPAIFVSEPIDNL